MFTSKDTQMCKSQYEDNVVCNTFASDDFILSPPSESKLLDANLKCQNQYSIYYLQITESL